MADVLRDLQVRASLDASGVQRGLDQMRASINDTSRALDEFGRRSVAPTVDPGVTNLVKQFDPAAQQQFSAIRGRVGLIYSEMAKAQAALDAALAVGNEKSFAAANRSLSTWKRALSQQQLEARGLGLANLTNVIGPSAEKAGEAAGLKMAEGAEHGLGRALGRLLRVRLPLNIASAGFGFIGAFVGVEKGVEAIGEAARETEKLQKDLAALRAESGLSADDVAKIGARALASGVDIESLSAAFKSLRASGLSLEDAVAQVRSLSDVDARAARAQELFGDSAAKLTPLLAQEGIATQATADQVKRLTDLQRLQQVGRALETRPTPVIGGLGDFFNGLGTNVNQVLREIQAASDAAAALRARNPQVSEAQIRAARDEAIQRVRDEINAEITLGTKIDENAAKQVAFNERIGRLRDAIGSDAQKVLDLGLKLHLPDSQIAAALAPYGVQLSDLTEESISRAAKAGLEKAFDEARLSVVVKAETALSDLADRRQSILERIQDIEENIADRHKSAARDALEFSKAELDARLRARDLEKVFVDAQQRAHPGADTSRADARDRREIGKLQAELADIAAKTQAERDKLKTYYDDLYKGFYEKVFEGFGFIRDNPPVAEIVVRVEDPNKVFSDIDSAEELLGDIVDRRIGGLAARAKIAVRSKRPSPFAVRGGGTSGGGGAGGGGRSW